MVGEGSSLPKVLIVDDSRMVRASLIKHIRGRFQVREEGDGEAGWQALVVDPSVEMVLTDIGMPRLDGYGLLERIRSSKLARLHAIPVVVISGDEDDEAREKARQLGANDFIAKGISSTELLARLDSLWQLAKTQRALEESRAELEHQRSAESLTALHADPIDPTTYLNMNWDSAQQEESAVPEVDSQQNNVSVMAIEVDQYDALVKQHGANVAHLVVRKLLKILQSKSRPDDTVSQLSPQRLSILSANADMTACCAFALLLQKAIGKLVMAYREERIRITISVGVTSSLTDHAETGEQLVGIATARLDNALNEGGNCVVGDQGVVTQALVDRMLRHAVSIDQMLLKLRIGDSDTVGAQLPDIVATLMPLLELMESQLRCGMPLEILRAYQAAGEKNK